MRYPLNALQDDRSLPSFDLMSLQGFHYYYSHFLRGHGAAAPGSLEAAVPPTLQPPSHYSMSTDPLNGLLNAMGVEKIRESRHPPSFALVASSAEESFVCKHSI